MYFIKFFRKFRLLNVTDMSHITFVGLNSVLESWVIYVKVK